MKNTKKQVLLTNDTFELCGWTYYTHFNLSPEGFKWTFRKIKMGVEFELTFSEFTYDVLICRVTPFNKQTVFQGRVFNPSDFIRINRCIFDAIE